MASTSQSNEASKRLLILQIEDNRADAELALLELSNAGFEVSSDVVDTLADVASHLAAKSYDVVLADYRLPGWVGTDALKIVRQHQADVPFILVSGTLGDETAVECVKNGVTDFVLKGHLSRLSLAVQRALREKSLREQCDLALNEMAESELRFRNLVEASPDAIFVHLEGKIVFANPATLTLLGARTLEEIKKKDVSEIVHPDDFLKIKKQISIVFDRGTASAPVEHTLIKMDGSSVAVEAVGIPITWAGSRAIEVVVRDITERKRAQQTVLEWMQRMELAEKAALPIALWEWNVSDDTRVWSREFYRQLGYTDDKHRGTREEFLNRVHPEDRPRVETAIQSIVSGLSQMYEAQFRVIRPDGTTCWLDSRGVMVPDGSPRMIGISIDITDLKKTQEFLQENEEKYRLLLNSTAEGICGIDLNGLCIFCNQSAARMLGYENPDELLGKHVHCEHHYTHPDGTPFPEGECPIYQTLRHEVCAHVDDDILIRVDGTIVPCEYWSYPIRRGEKIVGAVVTFLDITNRKRAEDRLRHSEANYRSIVDTAPYGISRADLEGHFLMANLALVRMLGYESEDELLSLDLARDVYVDPKQQAELVAQTLNMRSTTTLELDWKRKDGRQISVRDSIAPLRDDSGQVVGFQGFIEDVTERKVLEKQFWQAQKFEAVGRLAGGIAHDFNNILMVVSSYAELIKQRKGSDDKVNRYADQIYQAATRAVVVTRQLLAFSRQQILEPEVLDLNAVVSELGKVLPKMMREDIAVVTMLEPALHRVKVDRGQMEQIIMNLAANARDAMPKGGCFEIKTENVELDATRAAKHPPMNPGPYVKLTVVDTGIGMHAETQSHIFEPFFTTKDRGKGTGLGLAMVYGVVKQSGGFIWVTSEVGRGTRVGIYFPQVGEPITRGSKPLATTAISAGSETVLIVEDEEALRAATCEFLQSRGYTVLAAGDGAEAIRVCERHHGTIDVILTDLVMPGVDGIELAKAMTTRYPDIRVLYMSGYTDRFVEGFNAGTMLLQKPFTLAFLASKLRAVLDTKKSDNN
jgi:PAS domain S-box-containing protein